VGHSLIDLFTVFVYVFRIMISNVNREILLSFWKAHILFHASEGPIYGQSLLLELRRHGYEISPGTMYPLLKRMVSRGWLTRKKSPCRSSKERQEFILSAHGREVLAVVREKIEELHREVCGK